MNSSEEEFESATKAIMEEYDVNDALEFKICNALKVLSKKFGGGSCFLIRFNQSLVILREARCGCYRNRVGKTEAFMLPMILHLANEAMEHEESQESIERAVRALILYPMNALVADQVSRLRDYVGDVELNEHIKDLGYNRTPQFGMYTSRAPFHGWYAKLKVDKDGNQVLDKDGNRVWDNNRINREFTSLLKAYDVMEHSRTHLWEKMLKNKRFQQKGSVSLRKNDLVQRKWHLGTFLSCTVMRRFIS